MIMETRRQFLLDAATLGAGLAFGAAPAACRKPLLRVGIASDLHIRRSASVDTGKDNWSSDRFERVLSVYRDLGADAIMVPGDIADWGLVSQLVVVVKDTTVAYVVSYPDLMQNARVLISNYDALVSMYFVVALIYIAINYATNRFSIYLAHRSGAKIISRTEENPV